MKNEAYIDFNEYNKILKRLLELEIMCDLFAFDGIFGLNFKRTKPYNFHLKTIEKFWKELKLNNIAFDIVKFNDLEIISPINLSFLDCKVIFIENNLLNTFPIISESVKLISILNNPIQKIEKSENIKKELIIVCDKVKNKSGCKTLKRIDNYELNLYFKKWN